MTSANAATDKSGVNAMNMSRARTWVRGYMARCISISFTAEVNRALTATALMLRNKAALIRSIWRGLAINGTLITLLMAQFAGNTGVARG